MALTVEYFQIKRTANLKLKAQSTGGQEESDNLSLVTKNSHLDMYLKYAKGIVDSDPEVRIHGFMVTGAFGSINFVSPHSPELSLSRTELVNNTVSFRIRGTATHNINP